MPRNKEKNELAIKQSKECILNASLFLFSIYGYQLVGIDDIAKVSNCSRGLIYHYFKDKENLFNDMMHLVAEKMYSITEAIDYSQKAEIALRELIDSLLSKLNSSELNKFDNNYACMFYLILNLHLQRDFVPKPRVDTSNRPLERKRLFEIIYYLIEKGQKEKVFYKGDPKAYTISILSMLKGLSYTKIYLKEKMTSPTTDMVMNIVKGGNNEA